MRNGAWTPWDRARFAAVKKYDDLRFKNEKNGIGNSHLMDPMDFVRLMNDSKASFDPYRYMAEMQEKVSPHAGRARLTITDHIETDDDSQRFVDAQESSRVLPSAVSDVPAQESSQEGTQKKVNEAKRKPGIIDLEKKNQEGDLPVAALRKNIDGLLSAFELSFDSSSFENKKNEEAVAALKKNIEELLSDFYPSPSEKKNREGAVAASDDAEIED